MLDQDEWRWIEEHATGDFDHLVLATSLPFLLAPGLHHLEAWNEAVCEGAWGRTGRAGRRSGSARPSTWSTGAPSTTRSRGSPT